MLHFAGGGQGARANAPEMKGGGRAPYGRKWNPTYRHTPGHIRRLVDAKRILQLPLPHNGMGSPAAANENGNSHNPKYQLLPVPRSPFPEAAAKQEGDPDPRLTTTCCAFGSAESHLMVTPQSQGGLGPSWVVLVLHRSHSPISRRLDRSGLPSIFAVSGMTPAPVVTG